MSGLVKAKKYDWKDSNMALVGTDTDRAVKKESAETELAWKGAGESVGIQIWRIVKFKVKSWPSEDYGKFYNGDSYIILNTYKEADSDELNYDLHFWIGSQSTQDEYGTAAYKTVELDTLLDDKPVQHREVEGHESELFLSYFKSFTMMKGGADSGFRHVEPTKYEARLFHCRGDRKRVVVTQVPLNRSKLNSGDVFILDLGLQIYQWNGAECNKDEKFKAVQYIQNLKSERHGKPKNETLEEGLISNNHHFYESLPVDGEDDDDDDEEDDSGNFTPTLFRLSNDSGELTFSNEGEGEIMKSGLDSSDVFIIDTGKDCFVWIGSGASREEKQNSMAYAHKYLSGTQHPLVPVTVVKEGKETKALRAILN
ncbi:gelsolin-like protein 2 [Apostichopus japonicus]|uniref:gelsolin-like protein 2 n=1 Tax=Stichopus japonicus TaxID=307972 RepID=UPI003AB28950